MGRVYLLSRGTIAAVSSVIIIFFTFGCESIGSGPGRASRERIAKVNLVDFDADLDGDAVVITFRIKNELLAPIDISVKPWLTFKRADDTRGEKYYPSGNKWVEFYNLPKGLSEVLEIRMDLGNEDPDTLQKIEAHLDGTEVGYWTHTVVAEGVEGIELGECTAIVEGDEVVISGIFYADEDFVGTAVVSVSTHIESGVERYSQGPEDVLVDGGSDDPSFFEHTIPIPEHWQVPQVDDFWARVKSKEGDWGKIIRIARVCCPPCTYSSAALHCSASISGSNSIVVIVALINDNDYGYQTVEFEPYARYELADGTTGEVSDTVSTSVESTTYRDMGGYVDHRPELYTWSGTLPVSINELVSLEAGVRTPGVDWNIILHEGSGEGSNGVFVDTTRCDASIQDDKVLIDFCVVNEMDTTQYWYIEPYVEVWIGNNKVDRPYIHDNFVGISGMNGGWDTAYGTTCSQIEIDVTDLDLIQATRIVAGIRRPALVPEYVREDAHIIDVDWKKELTLT
jgi:hypothetical protein